MGASGPKPRRGAGGVGSRYRPRSTQTHGGEGGRQSLRGAPALAGVMPRRRSPAEGTRDGGELRGCARRPSPRSLYRPAAAVRPRAESAAAGRPLGREESAAAGLGPALRRAGFHHARRGGGGCRAARRTSPCRCRPVAPCPPCYAACAASSARPPPSSAPGPPRPRPPWTVRTPRRCWRPFGRRCGSR